MIRFLQKNIIGIMLIAISSGVIANLLYARLDSNPSIPQSENGSSQSSINDDNNTQHTKLEPSKDNLDVSGPKTNSKTDNPTKNNESEMHNKILQGYWDFNYNVSHILTSQGLKTANKKSISIRILFHQENRNFIGYYISSSLDELCFNASITGNIKDNSVISFEVFHEKDCCEGARIRFTGKLINNSKIVGRVEPISASPVCTSFYAEIEGFKDNSNNL